MSRSGSLEITAEASDLEIGRMMLRFLLSLEGKMIDPNSRVYPPRHGWVEHIPGRGWTWRTEAAHGPTTPFHRDPETYDYLITVWPTPEGAQAAAEAHWEERNIAVIWHPDRASAERANRSHERPAFGGHSDPDDRLADGGFHHRCETYYYGER